MRIWLFLHKTAALGLASVGVALSIGCGGGSGPGGGAGGGDVSDQAVTLARGVFLDSAVQGLSYQTASAQGVTNGNGGFDYLLGEEVRFSYGAIVFPTVQALSTVTPLQMGPNGSLLDPEVVNVAWLLQQLDVDLNPNNGIQLAATMALNMQAVAAEDFSLPSAQFQALPNVITSVAAVAALRADPTARRTPEQASAHLSHTLLGLLDGQTIPDLGCEPNPLTYRATRSELNTKLWADQYVKPVNAFGWVYGNDFLPRLNAGGGVMTRYQPQANAPEVMVAMQSADWSNAYSLTHDVWLKHNQNTQVVLRIAARASAQETASQPGFVGKAMYLIFTGRPGQLLEFQFDTAFEPQVFFSFIGDTRQVFTGTGGRDGRVNTGDDGVLPVGLTGWDQHQPTDLNFPPNLRKGGTTAQGQVLDNRRCVLKPMGSVLLWNSPAVGSDLIYSPSFKTNFWGVEAPIYTDAWGYEASVGIRQGVKLVGILAP